MATVILSTGHAKTPRNMLMDKSGWKTHCFGRYLVDLPPQAEVRAAYKLWGTEIERLPGINAPSLQDKVDKRAIALQSMSHDTAGSMLVRRIDHGNGSTSLLSWSSPRRTILMYEEAYLATTSPWQAFKYSGDISASRQAMAVAFLDTLAANIRSRADNEIPTGPGFCIDQGFIAGNDYRSESVQVGITLPQHPNAFISFDASTGAEEDRLLERVDNFLTKAVLGPLAGLKVLRKRERNVGAIPAEEYATAATGNGQRVYVFAWESQGKNKSLSEQNVSAGLRVLEQPVDSPQTPYQPAFQSDDDALQLWDAIIDSIRLRPGAV
ncbi:T6SS immunity protein Tli4 family protein [Cupriavidus taiwanensis]|uniref:T6SS immunity protein Tli4 family protein n=1 Tax=Cupriavidus taiwanensis TaxID=164546 RepID=UPI00253FFC09|nr:T6SS immunity protein Tli4 family protein [Cupriavidus taiwanensis]MDK3025633.1 T6SS immunity protein Tli4 family protein [Cupriavidus taiwanensis]